MKLVGSRTTDTFDAFSDWDFSVDSHEDFEQIASKIADAAAWNLVKRGKLYVATVVDSSGMLWDYSGVDDDFGDEWQKLGTPTPHELVIYDYWIIAFKHLKGLYRGFNQLGAVGIEMSTGLARDIYLERQYDIRNYKNFYTYKQIASVVEADVQLQQVTGLAYTTTAEKLFKLGELNKIILGVSHDISTLAYQAFQVKAQELKI